MEMKSQKKRSQDNETHAQPTQHYQQVAYEAVSGPSKTGTCMPVAASECRLLVLTSTSNAQACRAVLDQAQLRLTDPRIQREAVRRLLVRLQPSTGTTTRFPPPHTMQSQQHLVAPGQGFAPALLCGLVHLRSTPDLRLGGAQQADRRLDVKAALKDLPAAVVVRLDVLFG